MILRGALPIVASAWMGFAATAGAEEGGGDEDLKIINEVESRIGIFDFGWGVPGAPALQLLGKAGADTKPETSLRKFILALPDFAMGDEDGQTIAFAFSPAYLIRPSGTTFNHYRTHRWDRVLQRTQITVAAFEGVEAEEADKAQQSALSVGAKLSLLDGADPLMADEAEGGPFLQRCLTERLKPLQAQFDVIIAKQKANAAEYQQVGIDIAAIRLKAGQTTDPAELQKLTEQVQAKEARKAELNEELKLKLDEVRATTVDDNAETVEQLAQRCAEGAGRRAAYGQALDVGFGAIWRGEPGDFSGFESPAGAIWVAFRQPLGSPAWNDKNPSGDPSTYWLLAAQGRYAFGEDVDTGDEATPTFEADVLEGWIGIQAVSDDFRIAAHAGYTDFSARHDAAAQFEHSGVRYLVSADLKVLDSGVWASVSYGSANGTLKTQKDDRFMLSVSFSPPAAVSIASPD